MMRTTALPVLALFCATQAPAQTQGSSTDDIASLKEQLKALQDRIVQIEDARARDERQRREQPAPAATAAASAPADVVTRGDIPNSFKLPGTNTSMSIGGFVKGVAVRSSRAGLVPSPALTAQLADISLVPPTIPLSTTPETGLRKGNWKLSAQESRLIVRTSTPTTAFGPFTTLIEGDFFGYVGNETSTNGHNFRVRHAWATLGNVSAGQYWSNMVNLTAAPETIDFSPPLGLFGGLRQAQVRYTMPLSWGAWSVSMENPESVIVLNSANTGASTTPDNDKLPDFTTKVHFGLGPGEFEVAATYRRPNTAQGPIVYRRQAAGISTSGFVPTFGSDRFVFGLGYGRGSGHMLAIVADGVVTAGGLERINESSGYVGYRHYWLPTLRSNIDYSWINANNPGGLSAGTAGGLNKKFWSTHVNLIWNPIPSTDVGIEFLRAMRQVESGVHGDLNRWMLMGRFFF